MKRTLIIATELIWVMDFTLKLTLHILVTDSQTQSWFQSWAAVQIVDGSYLRAHADLQEWPISGSGDVCWLTAVPKLASWQLCCWGLSVLAGHRFDPDLTSLTSWQDFCSEQQCWHWHTHTRTHTCTHTHSHKHTRAFAHTRGRLANISSPCAMGELRGTVLYRNNRIIARHCRLVCSDGYLFFFFYQHKCANNIRLDSRSRLQRETAETSIWMDSWGTEVNFGDSCSIQGLQSTLHHMEI